jgi:hypothetical protein
LKGFPSETSNGGSAERYSDRLSEDERFPLHSGALYSEERILEEERSRAKTLVSRISPQHAAASGLAPALTVRKLSK